jgi:hypothetical protein
MSTICSNGLMSSFIGRGDDMMLFNISNGKLMHRYDTVGENVGNKRKINKEQ